ncbi:hypothetical protein [Streptomyces sp. 1222.5]|uniref:hypothetical protein n=1 Tax=Streptomyces sp. 1222.5 TaxID=1881026 RepID=UPI003EB7867F
MRRSIALAAAGLAAAGVFGSVAPAIAADCGPEKTFTAYAGTPESALQKARTEMAAYGKSLGGGCNETDSASGWITRPAPAGYITYGQATVQAYCWGGK